MELSFLIVLNHRELSFTAHSAFDSTFIENDPESGCSIFRVSFGRIRVPSELYNLRELKVTFAEGAEVQPKEFVTVKE